MTLDQLIRMLPYSRPHAAKYLPWLNATMAEFNINTPVRQAAFIAQVGHESGSLAYTVELASGQAYDTGQLAARLGNTPEADGDGQRWKGHGLLQVTGAANHRACAAYFGLPLDGIVAWLTTPEGACRSAGWFWSTHGLNQLADSGDQVAVTRGVNGGINGLAARLALFNVAIRVLA
jgi:putative chitinase